MGAKQSLCSRKTLEYIRSKNLDKLTQQLSKRISKKKDAAIELLQFELENDQQQRSILHFA
ncbi:unnamed protein product, partial [Didymodactylos carnosus]